MATETVTEYETVERERERTLCDFCGLGDDETDEFGDFHEVLLSTDIEHYAATEHYSSNSHADLGKIDLETMTRPGKTRIYIRYEGPTTDLCPLCYDTLFGEVYDD